MVIMLTDDTTLHGYRPIDFPAGRYRTSIASYAYTLYPTGSNGGERATRWYSDNWFRRQVGARWPQIVRLKTSIFGSTTAKRAADSENRRER